MTKNNLIMNTIENNLNFFITFATNFKLSLNRIKKNHFLTKTEDNENTN